MNAPATAPASWPGFRSRMLMLLDYACAHREGSPPTPCMVPAERLERIPTAKPYGYLGFCLAHFEMRKARRDARQRRDRAQLRIVR